MGLHFLAAAVENHLPNRWEPGGGAAVVRTSSRTPSFCHDLVVMLCWEEMKIKMMQPGSEQRYPPCFMQASTN